MFEDCYRQLIANEITALHVCYLLGAATLERALGNVSEYGNCLLIRRCAMESKQIILTIYNG